MFGIKKILSKAKKSITFFEFQQNLNTPDTSNHLLVQDRSFSGFFSREFSRSARVRKSLLVQKGGAIVLSIHRFKHTIDQLVLLNPGTHANEATALEHYQFFCVYFASHI